jgi:hypothetical protein
MGMASVESEIRALASQHGLDLHLARDPIGPGWNADIYTPCGKRLAISGDHCRVIGVRATLREIMRELRETVGTGLEDCEEHRAGMCDVCDESLP